MVVISLVLLGLGYDKVKNYDGSRIEWANNPTLPIIDAQGQLDSSVQVSLVLGAQVGTGVSTKPVVNNEFDPF